jgi:hypothetical protein
MTSVEESKAVTFTKGTKSPNDQKVFINGYQVTFHDIAVACLQFFKNEDDRYNEEWHLGGKMLVNFLAEVNEKKAITEEMLIRYKLRNPNGDRNC